jgi:type IX secretion system PorP/SprF family membrane protein
MIKHNKYRILFYFFAFGLMSQEVQSQWFPDQFAYNLNSLLLNPAHAGNEGESTVRIIGRYNFFGFDNGPQMQTVSGNLKVQQNIGLGVSVMDYRSGPMSTQRMTFDGSYKIRLGNKIYASAGLRAMYWNHSLSLSNLQRTVQNDPAFNGIYNRADLVDFGAGLLLYSEKSFFGVSVPQVRDYKKSDSPEFAFLRRTYHAYAGYTFNIKKTFKLRTNVLYRYFEDYYHGVDLNAQLSYLDKIHFGTCLRLDRSVGISAGMDVSKHWYLGYLFNVPYADQFKYGIPVSNEFSIRFKFKQPALEQQIISPRFFD